MTDIEREVLKLKLAGSRYMGSAHTAVNAQAVAAESEIPIASLLELIGPGLVVGTNKVTYSSETGRITFTNAKVARLYPSPPADGSGHVNAPLGNSQAPEVSGPFQAKVEAERLEDLAKKEWESDASLRAEFGTFGAYFGWRKAEAEGKAKIFAGNTVRRYSRPATGQ